MDGNNCKFNLSVECRDLQNSAYFRFAITPEIIYSSKLTDLANSSNLLSTETVGLF